MKFIKRYKWFLILAVIAMIGCTASYNTLVYKAQGGAELVVASGGQITVESGGTIDYESGAALEIAGTAVTASAAELNLIDGSIAGTSVASKALVLGTSKDTDVLVVDTSLDVTGTFYIGSAAVTSTAAELNILDTVTANATELNYLDTTVPGTSVASKVLALGASKDTDILVISDTDGFTYGGYLRKVFVYSADPNAATFTVAATGVDGDDPVTAFMYSTPSTPTYILNAAQTTDGGGTITVTLSGDPGEAIKVIIETLQD